MLTYHPTTEAEKEAICAWRTPANTAMYNNPPYAEQKKHGYGFANRKQFHIPFTMAKRWWAREPVR